MTTERLTPPPVTPDTDIPVATPANTPPEQTPADSDFATAIRAQSRPNVQQGFVDGFARLQRELGTAAVVLPGDVTEAFPDSTSFYK